MIGLRIEPAPQSGTAKISRNNRDRLVSLQEAFDGDSARHYCGMKREECEYSRKEVLHKNFDRIVEGRRG